MPLTLSSKTLSRSAGAHRGGAGDVEDALDALASPRAPSAGRATSPPTRSNSRSTRWSALDPRRSSSRSSSPALRERADQVRAEEAAAACDEGLGHELRDGRAVIQGVGEHRSRTAVVSDTTAYLPDELVAAHGIHRVSLYVSLEGEQRREIEIDRSEYADFYERLRRSDEGATTSQPSIGDFVVGLRAAAGRGQARSSRSTSRPGISGTCESARAGPAAPHRRGTREASGSTSSTAAPRRGGQGLVVLAAARRGRRRAPAAPRRSRPPSGAARRLEMWFAIDTLEYLRKGGRIGAAQAWLGSALQIKPILTLGEEITPIERVRTRRRALERLVEYARQRHADGADAWVVQHIQDPETAAALVEQGREIFGSEPAFVSEVGPVIGAPRRARA